MIAPGNPADAAERIHRTSLELLQDPGIRLEHDGIFQLVLRRGARAGLGAQVVRISGEMVKEALETCLRQFPICDMKPIVGDYP